MKRTLAVIQILNIAEVVEFPQLGIFALFSYFSTMMGGNPVLPNQTGFSIIEYL